MLDKLLDLIFPPVCGVCGRLNKEYLCKKCEIQLKRQSVFGIDDYSNAKEKYFDEHLYVFMYGGIIRSMLLNYKFNDKPYLYKTIVKYLLKSEKFVEKIKSYDIIIAVPLSRKRKGERGYNQSSLIATEISKILKIELRNECLEKIKNIAKQSTLSKDERQINIQGAYMLRNLKKLYHKKILLIDDIFTTGSTANECSKEIIKAGTNKIGLLTIAKD